MRTVNINRGWRFGLGPANAAKRLMGEADGRIVDLPHDYMI